ncbi:MAG: PH domain-containing protein [Pseudomonadota bacterium]
MSYVIKTLATNEKIVYRARFNWTYEFAADLWLYLSLLPLLVNVVFGRMMGTRTWEESAMLVAISAAPIALGLVIWLQRMIHKWSTEIVVTSQRFIFKTGLIARRSSEVNLGKIEEVSLRQSFLGRLFNYGEITVRGTGVGVLELPPLDEPITLRRNIQNAKSEYRNDD